MTKVYAGDVGTVLTFDCGTDVTTATLAQIKVRKPGVLEPEVWTASIQGPNSIQYTTQVGDLADPGTYKFQAYVELPTWKGLGDTVFLEVHRPFS